MGIVYTYAYLYIILLHVIHKYVSIISINYRVEQICNECVFTQFLPGLFWTVLLSLLLFKAE
jgi:hypothetical protein